MREPARIGRTKPGVYLAQTLVALAIAYLFVVVLMTAATQQRAVTRLDNWKAEDQTAEPIDYSTAWARVKAAKSDERRLLALRTEEDTAVKLLAARQSKLASARTDVDAAWERFAPLATRARRIRDCEVPKPEGGATPLQAWNAVVACSNDNLLPESLRQQLFDQSLGPHFGAAYTAGRQAGAALPQAEADLAAVKTKIAPLEARISGAASLRDVFSEMTLLETSWLLGGGVLAAMPPTLVQIILAFVSGAFGALLITLVLLVYPDNRFKASGSQVYMARIFLGAVISLTTFILLGAGTGVLGSSSPFEQSQANFMAFAAVGILAGMFSDRVAGWLSARADAFFGERQADGEPPNEAA